MSDYYAIKLSAERLKKVYDIAPPRTHQYLQAEIDFVLENIDPEDTVLELGCGYGRVLKPMAQKGRQVTGIDSSKANIKAAGEFLSEFNNIRLFRMNAVELGFKENTFSKVICIQNGISAFHVDPTALINEAVRVTVTGGTVLFSSYSEEFWDERLEWFKIQSEYGLVGKIDWDKTKDGNIVCFDGFRATTLSRGDFESLMSHFKLPFKIYEIDDSSIFCAIKV